LTAGSVASMDLDSVGPEEIEAFKRDGYLTLRRVTTDDDVRRIRELLDGLFHRFATLPAGRAVDLGPDPHTHTPRILEVNHAIQLEPRLKRTLAFARCRAIARALLERRAYYSFDHAISKPPHNETATPWHQDQAYRGDDIDLASLHFWIALQNVDGDNGCMNFIPGSHRWGLVPHTTRGPHAHALVAEAIDTSTAVACPVPAGGATVHGPYTLHYTGPNQTGEPRGAWIVHFSPYGRLGSLRPSNVLSRLRDLVRRSASS
jgi:hypothetical protein